MMNAKKKPSHARRSVRIESRRKSWRCSHAHGGIAPGVYGARRCTTGVNPLERRHRGFDPRGKASRCRYVENTNARIRGSRRCLLFASARRDAEVAAPARPMPPANCPGTLVRASSKKNSGVQRQGPQWARRGAICQMWSPFKDAEIRRHPIGQLGRAFGSFQYAPLASCREGIRRSPAVSGPLTGFDAPRYSSTARAMASLLMASSCACASLRADDLNGDWAHGQIPPSGERRPGP